MSTLFIDIDDTLVKWKGTFDRNSTEENWEANEKVIAYAEHWDGSIIVWSGGGARYSEMWARRLLPNLDWEAYSKFDTKPQVGDTTIDDSPYLGWLSVNILPWDLK